MTDEEKQAKKEYQKNYYKKLKAYKDELFQEKQGLVKQVANYYKKKRNKCKKMSKIKIKQITNKFNDYDFVFAQYIMSPKFSEIELHKKEFRRSKQPIYLNQVEISKIVISDQFKLDGGVKSFTGYKNGENSKPLRIILLQISGFIKYF